MRLILVVALLCFLSPISSAMELGQARTYCVDIAEAGVTLVAVKDSGAPKHIWVDRLNDLHKSGEIEMKDAQAILWVIEYVYSSDETHETIREPMFRACMKEMGFSES